MCITERGHKVLKDASIVMASVGLEASANNGSRCVQEQKGERVRDEATLHLTNTIFEGKLNIFLCPLQ